MVDDLQDHAPIGVRWREVVSAVAALVSTANILIALCLVFIPANFGHLLLPVGSGASYFALFAFVIIVVTAATWPQSLRLPGGYLRVFRHALRSGLLTVLAMMAALTLFGALYARYPADGLYRAEAWPEWVCLVAVAVTLTRFELDPEPRTLLSPLLTRVPDASRSARVLSVVSVIAFVATIALVVVAAVPHLSVPIAALWVQPVVLLVVTAASFSRHNRWAPDGGFKQFRAVTPARLMMLALASVFVQLPLATLLAPDRGFGPSYWGILVLFGVFVVGLIGTFAVRDDGPTKRGKRSRGSGPRAARPRGSEPIVYVGKLAQVEVSPLPGWVTLPYRFPTDGYANATAWAAGMLPRLGAEIGAGTDEQKKIFARAVVSIINSRLKRSLSRIYLKLDGWDAPHLTAGMSTDVSQPWRGMPVRSLDQEVSDAPKGDGAPLTAFQTTSGLQGHKRQSASRVDYWVDVDGGWAHLSCEDDPERLEAALPNVEALASAIFIGDRVVGRRKKLAQ